MSKTARHHKAKRWPIRYYIAVDEKGKPILRDAQVPIFWRKGVAKDEFKNWPGSKIKRCSILIEP